MLTDKNACNNRKLLKKMGEGGKDIEVVIDKIIKKPYGNVYSYDAKKLSFNREL
jgi:hypothetical protein